MTVQVEFDQDRGIYGRKSWTGYCPTLASPFAVFKDENDWTIGHRKSGLSVASLIPKGYRKARRSLLDLLVRRAARTRRHGRNEQRDGLSSPARLSGRWPAVDRLAPQSRGPLMFHLHKWSPWSAVSWVAQPNNPNAILGYVQHRHCYRCRKLQTRRRDL